MKLLSDPVAAIFRPGFWLHGGIAGAGIGILLCRDAVKRPLEMAAALGLVLPLFEAFSRLGCHSYGCCFGRTLTASEAHGASRPLLWRLVPVPATVYRGSAAAAVRARPELRGQALFPVQRISAVVYAMQFAAVAAMVWCGWMSVVAAGWMSVLLHAGVRLVTEQVRDDFRGDVGARVTATGVLAGAQMLAGAAGLVWGEKEAWGGDSVLVVDKEVLGCTAFAFMLGFTVYGYNFRRIGVWVDRKL